MLSVVSDLFIILLLIMYLQIKRLKVYRWNYGNNFHINKIWLYKDDGEFIKWVKLNNSCFELVSYNLEDLKIPLNLCDDTLDEKNNIDTV